MVPLILGNSHIGVYRDNGALSHHLRPSSMSLIDLEVVRSDGKCEFPKFRVAFTGIAGQ